MSEAREEPVATLMNNGTVLIVGGQDVTVDASGAELYDSGSGIFTDTGAIGQDRVVHTANLLVNGKVFIAGGRDASCDQNYNITEIYNPMAATFSSGPKMTAERSAHTATL